MEPRTILNIAKRVGLGAVAITDHNTIRGGVDTCKIRERNSPIVIIGSEISTNVGDVIGLFLSKEIKSRNVLDVIQEIKSQDGLIILPHPFHGHKLHEIVAIMNSIDLLEGFNPRHLLAQEQVKKLKVWNKPLVAGSDAHFPQEIGLAKTVFQMDASNEEEIRKSLLYKKVVVQGISAPPYLESMSQIIKGLKYKSLKILGLGLIGLTKCLVYKRYGNTMKNFQMDVAHYG